MPQKEELRIYNVKIHKHQADVKTSKCNDFITFVKREVDRLHKLYRFEEYTEADCIVELKVECYSCGKLSINSFESRVRNRHKPITFWQTR